VAHIEELKSGSYRFRVHEGGGKYRKQTWVPPKNLTPAKLEKELTRRAALFEEQVKHGQAADSTMKLSEVYHHWRDNYATVNNNIAPKTLYTYDILWKRIDAQLGHIRVDKLTPPRLQAFYAWLSEEAIQVPNGKKNKDAPPKGLSPKTIHHYHRLLSSILTYAVELQFIADNPCKRVRAPKKPIKEAYALTPEQVGRIVAALDGEPLQFQVMVMLFLQTGMRKSELVGLTWADYEPEHALLRVACELQYLPPKGEKPRQGSLAGLQIRPPKNESSKRHIKLPQSMVELLEVYRALQDEWKANVAEVGGAWQEDTPAHLRHDFIFTSELGSPRHPDSFPKAFKKFLSRVGFAPEEIKLIHTHTLRHTAASFLIEGNVNLTAVAKHLGHADSSTTSRIYAHAINRTSALASSVIDTAIQAARGTVQPVGDDD